MLESVDVAGTSCRGVGSGWRGLCILVVRWDKEDTMDFSRSVLAEDYLDDHRCSVGNPAGQTKWPELLSKLGSHAHPSWLDLGNRLTTGGGKGQELIQ
eukprot:11216487-Lingulodinium_polyedra.AAC.1